MSFFRVPLLGAAYYPEAWPGELIDDDIRLMLDAGMTVARMGEFAWSSFEPKEGRIELGWLRRAVDKLAASGIASKTLAGDSFTSFLASSTVPNSH